MGSVVGEKFSLELRGIANSQCDLVKLFDFCKKQLCNPLLI